MQYDHFVYAAILFYREESGQNHPYQVKESFQPENLRVYLVRFNQNVYTFFMNKMSER